MYKLITNAKDSDDLSIGFDCYRNRKRDELSIHKNLEGIYHPRVILRSVLGFAEHQKKLFMASVIN